MKKYFSLIIVVALIMVPLVGCSSSSSRNGASPATYKLYIFGTQSCPYCQQMKTLSTEMFGATNTIFIEINPAITGTQANLDKFCSLASVLSSQGCNDPNVGTPIVVLADGQNHFLALWIGYLEKTELQKVIDSATPEKPLYWPTSADGFTAINTENAAKVRQVVGLK